MNGRDHDKYVWGLCGLGVNTLKPASSISTDWLASVLVAVARVLGVNGASRFRWWFSRRHPFKMAQAIYIYIFVFKMYLYNLIAFLWKDPVFAGIRYTVYSISSGWGSFVTPEGKFLWFSEFLSRVFKIWFDVGLTCNISYTPVN